MQRNQKSKPQDPIDCLGKLIPFPNKGLHFRKAYGVDWAYCRKGVGRGKKWAIGDMEMSPYGIMYLRSKRPGGSAKIQIF